MNLGAHTPKLMSGREPFHENGRNLEHDVQSFWRWSSSAILGNALRGVLAEYIVALDVGCVTNAREEWDIYDLKSREGVKIEVKSASYLQTWKQKTFSKIIFGIQKTTGWDAEKNVRTEEIKRHADIYVFCVLAHKDKETVDPLDMSQWEFYILPTRILDQRLGAQKTIALSSLLKLNPIKTKFGYIGDEIKLVMLNNE